MVIKKQSALEILILGIIAKNKEINIRSVAQEAGLLKSNESDRKAIRRVLNSMIKRNLLKAKGEARARLYVPVVENETNILPFKDITLSAEGSSILKYVSKPLLSRMPVGYNNKFLSTYKPNQTYYLNKIQREELYSIGSVENKTRPAGTYARNILDRLLIDLSWNSSRLEGNTYSLLETKRLIELGESATGKDTSEAQMILNHKGAIEYIIESAEDKKITSHEICSIHALLSENLLGDPSASGRIRKITVGIKGTTYIPLENPHLLNEYFQLFVKKLNSIEDPFEQSFFSLVHLSYMQAFEDVNKRVARLVANIPLIKKNLRPLSFTDISNDAYIKALLGVYEKNDVALLRDLYIWAYNRSSQKYSAMQQSMGEPNALKLKYRTVINEIVRTLILEKVTDSQIVRKIRQLMITQKIPSTDTPELFKIIEIEILSLHDGNIARFKIRPTEFRVWKKLK